MRGADDRMKPRILAGGIILMMIVASNRALFGFEYKFFPESLDKNGVVTAFGQLSYDAAKKAGEVRTGRDQYTDPMHILVYGELFSSVVSLSKRAESLTLSIPLYEYSLMHSKDDASLEGQALSGLMAAELLSVLDNIDLELRLTKSGREHFSDHGWQEYRIHLGHYEQMLRRAETLVRNYMAERFPDDD